MVGAIGKRKRRDSGQSLLEFALLVPTLLLLMIGVIEIGRVIFYTIEVNNAATAGAQYGAQDAITAQNAGTMESYAALDAHLAGMTATASNGCTCDNGTGISCTYPIPGPGTCSVTNFSCPAGQHTVECVQVLTQATITPLFHFPGLPTTYQANGRAVMRVRQ